MNTRPSDQIRGLVCGMPEAARKRRILAMLKAYIDDSHIGAPPVYVLAGLLGRAETWATFSDEWDRILRMSPRIRHFKLAEAMNYTGEFHGISEERRNEKLILLINLIEEHDLQIVSSILPHNLFMLFFGDDSAREIRTPYYPMLYSLVGALAQHHNAEGITDKTDFIFDIQPGKMEYILRGWEEFRAAGNSLGMDHLICESPPTFKSDSEVVALQAADLIAGALQRAAQAQIMKLPFQHPWGARGSKIRHVGRLWTAEFAEYVFEQVYGFPYPKITATWDWGRPIVLKA